MNVEEALNSLRRIMSGILHHDLLPSELMQLIKESGVEQTVFKLLVIRLNVLNAVGINAIKTAEFENIGRGLYSMHLARKTFNIRILYSFLPNSQPVLLLAFYERGGKSKTDYSSYLGPALARFEEMKERFENENK